MGHSNKQSAYSWIPCDSSPGTEAEARAPLERGARVLRPPSQPERNRHVHSEKTVRYPP